MDFVNPTALIVEGAKNRKLSQLFVARLTRAAVVKPKICMHCGGVGHHTEEQIVELRDIRYPYMYLEPSTYDPQLLYTW
jgi:hypothetical protein